MQLNAGVSIYINIQTGKVELKIKDDTVWPVNGALRTDYYIGFYAYKVVVNLNVTPNTVTINTLSLATPGSNVVEFEQQSQEGLAFNVTEDGYHRLYMVPFPRVAGGVEGDYYYDGTNILYRENGSYVIKTFDELLALDAISDEYLIHYPAHPRASMELDKIAEKYSKGRSGSSDPDYKKWVRLYVQIYGALLSFDKMAYTDYDRKIRAANILF